MHSAQSVLNAETIRTERRRSRLTLAQIAIAALMVLALSQLVRVAVGTISALPDLAAQAVVRTTP